jgi:hypothetical protein
MEIEGSSLTNMDAIHRVVQHRVGDDAHRAGPQFISADKRDEACFWVQSVQGHDERLAPLRRHLSVWCLQNRACGV